MSYYSLISLMPKATVDPDAQAFITAAGITNPTQQSAINQLVVNLKGYNIWTKFKAIYPIVGGSSSSHKWNLKDPRDLDAAFRLQFTNSWTHSATGMTPSVALADTFFNSSINGQQNSQHISYYSRTNSNGTEIEIGGVDTSSRYSFIEARTSGISYYAINQTTSFPTHSDSDSRAFYISNRTASNVINGWKNGVKLATGTAASSSTNVAYQLGALNNLVVSSNKFYSTKQCAFASIGDGLTDTEAANFYTAVQAYQTTLGRQV